MNVPDTTQYHSLNNIKKISTNHTEKNNIEITLQNLRTSSEKLKVTINNLGPTGQNIKEFSETIKSQPWRLIWPSTKKSPEKSPTPAPSEATITVRKTTKPKASPTRAGGGR